MTTSDSDKKQPEEFEDGYPYEDHIGEMLNLSTHTLHIEASGIDRESIIEVFGVNKVEINSTLKKTPDKMEFFF